MTFVFTRPPFGYNPPRYGQTLQTSRQWLLVDQSDHPRCPGPAIDQNHRLPRSLGYVAAPGRPDRARATDALHVASAVLGSGGRLEAGLPGQEPPIDRRYGAPSGQTHTAAAR